MTPTPILLLKTKSSPHDTYSDFFSAHGYTPSFIPVLEHQFNTTTLQTVRELFETGSLAQKYGGLIFTSQRAVEGFARVIEDVGVKKASESSPSLILYTVGPATSRSLSVLRDTHLPHATIHGAECGNGENLARFMLEHYNANANANANTTTGEKLPLLFLVGEQRRDVIPKTLMDGNLPATDRIGVEEVVVYGTCVKESFEGDFAAAVRSHHRCEGGGGGGDDDDEEKVIWVVVFSPTGCDAMIRVLNLNENEREGKDKKRIFVATIGPTTRDHLRLKCGFEPDVCAEKPSEDGVGDGIERFMDEWRKGR